MVSAHLHPFTGGAQKKDVWGNSVCALTSFNQTNSSINKNNVPHISSCSWDPNFMPVVISEEIHLTSRLDALPILPWPQVDPNLQQTVDQRCVDVVHLLAHVNKEAVRVLGAKVKDDVILIRVDLFKSENVADVTGAIKGCCNGHLFCWENTRLRKNMLFKTFIYIYIQVCSSDWTIEGYWNAYIRGVIWQK